MTAAMSRRVKRTREGSRSRLERPIIGTRRAWARALAVGDPDPQAGEQPGPDVDGDRADLAQLDLGLPADELDRRRERLGVAPAPGRRGTRPGRPRGRRGRSRPAASPSRCPRISTSRPRHCDRPAGQGAGAGRPTAAASRAPTGRMAHAGRRRPAPKSSRTSRKSAGSAGRIGVAPLDAGRRPPSSSMLGEAQVDDLLQAGRAGRRRAWSSGQPALVGADEGEGRAGDLLVTPRPRAKPWANTVLPVPRSPASTMMSPGLARAATAPRQVARASSAERGARRLDHASLRPARGTAWPAPGRPASGTVTPRRRAGRRPGGRSGTSTPRRTGRPGPAAW